MARFGEKLKLVFIFLIQGQSKENPTRELREVTRDEVVEGEEEKEENQEVETIKEEVEENEEEEETEMFGNLGE